MPRSGRLKRSAPQPRIRKERKARPLLRRHGYEKEREGTISFRLSKSCTSDALLRKRNKARYTKGGTCPRASCLVFIILTGRSRPSPQGTDRRNKRQPRKQNPENKETPSPRPYPFLLRGNRASVARTHPHTATPSGKLRPMNAGATKPVTTRRPAVRPLSNDALLAIHPLQDRPIKRTFIGQEDCRTFIVLHDCLFL